MATIFHIMKEEFERLTRTEKMYRNQIQQLPKGTPRTKSIRRRSYLYLVHREGRKIVYDYIGASDSDKAKASMVQVEKRKRLQRLHSETKHMLKDVRKVLRGKV